MSTADDAWQEWSDANPDVHDGDTWPHRAFMAGYRRALEDAAENIPPSIALGMFSIERSGIRKWLRDRAAGVGTKDGDDDE